MIGHRRICNLNAHATAARNAPSGRSTSSSPLSRCGPGRIASPRIETKTPASARRAARPGGSPPSRRRPDKCPSAVPAKQRHSQTAPPRQCGNNVAGDGIDLPWARPNGGGNQAFKWIGTAKFHHVKGELHYTKSGTSVLVQGDINGDGRADIEILVLHTKLLAAGDFLL